MTDVDPSGARAVTPDQSRPATDEPSLKRPSPPWLGAIVSFLLFLGFAWIIVWGTFEPAWMRPLGAWNYLVGLVIMMPPVHLLRFLWHGDPPRYEGS